MSDHQAAMSVLVNPLLLGSTQLMVHLALLQNPSGLITAAGQPPSSFLILSSIFLLLTFLSSATYSPTHPPTRLLRVASHPLMEHTSHPIGRGEAALSLIDLALVLTQSSGETFWEWGTSGRVLERGRRGGTVGTSGKCVLCVLGWGTSQIITSGFYSAGMPNINEL